MTWTDLATWIGTGLAIISMGVAIWQACRATNAAARAEKMRNEITNRNAHSELASLSGALSAAIRSIDKYGPGAGPGLRRGSSPESDAASVRALTSEMTRLRELLVEKFGNEVSDVIKKINDLLIDFASAPGASERNQLGRDIFFEIVEFSGNIKKELDLNIFG
jgi:hypothetical protein